MKKILSILLAACIISALILSGCADPEKTTTTATTTATATATATTTATTTATSTVTVVPTTPTVVKEEWVVGGNLNYSLSADPLDPTSAYIGALQNMVFETLIGWESRKNADGTTTFTEYGVLAESYEWVEDLTFRIYLREGVKFQNGEDFTSADVKYSIDWVKANPTSIVWEDWDPFECEIVDTYTVDIISPGTHFLLSAIQGLSIAPASRGLTEASIEAFKENPAGTGPYKILEWALDKPVRLEAWTDYRDGVMKPKYVTVKSIEDPMTRLTALLAGEIDIMEGVTIDHLITIEASGDLALNTFEGGQLGYYQMQFLLPPFNDYRVRQAMIYAIDRQEMADTILGGHARVLASQVGPGWVGYNPDIEPYPYDPEKAIELLDEAGYPDGFEVDLNVSQGFRVKDTERAQAIQAYLALVGITANIVVQDMGTLWMDFYAGKFGARDTSWPLQAMEPNKTYWWAITGGFPEDELSGGVVPADILEMRALLAEIEETADLAEQATMFQELDRMLYDRAVLIPLYNQDLFWAYNKAAIGEWDRMAQAGTAAFSWFCDRRGLYP